MKIKEIKEKVKLAFGKTCKIVSDIEDGNINDVDLTFQIDLMKFLHDRVRVCQLYMEVMETSLHEIKTNIDIVNTKLKEKQKEQK